MNKLPKFVINDWLLAIAIVIGKKQKSLSPFRFPLYPNSKGFTLIEILVAITIISVVFGVLFGSFAQIQRSGRDTQRQSDIRNIQSSLQQYYTDQNFYPTSSLNLSSTTTFTSDVGNPNPIGSTKTYLKNVPQDPKSSTSTQPAYCYQPLPEGCDNSEGLNNKCQSYRLCAQLENTPASPASCSCGAKSNYNFEVDPI